MNAQIHKYAKYGVWATIIAALIGAAVTLYTYYDSKEMKGEHLKNETLKDNEKESASLTIKEIQITPVDFDIPSSFYVEIENDGYFEAKDITVLIDFGESKIEKCSVKPNNTSNLKQNGDDFIFKIKVNELLKNESLYINCLISSPIFKKVLISGGNVVGHSTELTYESYKVRYGKLTSGWYIFFSILAGIFFIYIFVVFLLGLNKKLGVL